MNRAEVVAALRALGWRVRTTGELHQVVAHFQDAWLLGPKLKVDGDPGPKTAAALATSVARLKAGKPTASEHFSFSEFACHCGGRFTSCARIWVQRDLLVSMEKLREKHYPQGLTVVSGGRCEGYNRSIGGASSSQHKYGAACDIAPRVSWRKLASDGLFAGIGWNRSSGLVAHVDRRDVSGHNTTRASRTRPTSWIYGR